MERVAFLVEQTGKRIACLLNPELIEMRRTAGVRARADAGGFLGGMARRDDPLIATGGGITELDLHLLFDTDVARAEAAPAPPRRDANGNPVPARAMDVRDLSRPIWDLAENAAGGDDGTPPAVRFIWGKSWNMPGVVVNVAERLERFDANGIPQRSWLALRLRRIDAPVPRPPAPLPAAPSFEPPRDAAAVRETQDHAARALLVGPDGAVLDRLDQIAGAHYGQPALAPLIADFNGLDDLLTIPEGTTLRLPPIQLLMSAA